MDEVALHELLSGRRRDVGARLLRGGLAVAACGYGAVMALRNFGYDRRWLSVARVDVPVISLGNITTGGTGKTPMAAWLANWLTQAGRTPGLLSRGYRSLEGEGTTPTEPSGQPTSHAMLARQEPRPPATSGAGNDEKLVLDRLCPGVPHIQQRDRVSSARQLVAEHRCDTLILDDGFQHRRLHRDLDIVLIDVLQPWGYGHLLPRGLLREPLAGLKRADLIVLTRADQVSPEQRRKLLDQLARARGTDESAQVAFVPQRLIGLGAGSALEMPLALDAVRGQRAFAFCGIGNPLGFARTAASLTTSSLTDASPHDTRFLRVFPDHHHYTERDLVDVASAAKAARAEIVLTTMKDFVKLRSEAWTGPPLYAIEIGVEFLNGQTLLEDRLRGLVRLPS